jgi:tRNA-dihydrouridine synthase
MKNFWQDLPKPFTALAPLDGVTDVVFRQIITEIGKPDVLFTEFTMVDGLLSPGRKKVSENLLYQPDQQPLVAQIWGVKPENFYTVAKEIREMGFAGIDINMGCPIRTIIRDGACSGLIKNPTLAAEIIQATKEGAGDIPVSVKTRVGFEETHIEKWLDMLLKQKIAALTVHLRTVAELSKVPAHWEYMPEISKLRDTLAPDTVLIGNGDIHTLAEIKEKFQQYRLDGFMVGRGIFANPWIFNPKVDMLSVSTKERIKLYLHHIDLFEERWHGEKNFALLKKFAKTYISNFDGAAEFRDRLMETQTMLELRTTLEEFNKHA